MFKSAPIGALIQTEGAGGETNDVTEGGSIVHAGGSNAVVVDAFTTANNMGSIEGYRGAGIFAEAGMSLNNSQPIIASSFARISVIWHPQGTS